MNSCDELLGLMKIPGTSFREGRKTVTVEPKNAENVRFYRTDDQPFRRAFDLEDKPVSDVVVDVEAPPLRTIVFVELKGNDTRRAIEQLMSTIEAVRGCLRTAIPGARLLAAIARSGSVPTKVDRAQREFFLRRCRDVKLIVKTTDTLDLRREGCLD